MSGKPRQDERQWTYQGTLPKFVTGACRLVAESRAKVMNGVGKM